MFSGSEIRDVDEARIVKRAVYSGIERDSAAVCGDNRSLMRDAGGRQVNGSGLCRQFSARCDDDAFGSTQLDRSSGRLNQRVDTDVACGDRQISRAEVCRRAAMGR